MKSYGEKAKRWSARRDDARYTVADQDGFASAFYNIVERRRAGFPQGLVALAEHPRTTLLRTIYHELTDGLAYDELQHRLNAFKFGGVAINGQSQEQTERNIVQPMHCAAFEHAGLAADLVVFRSHYEAELAVRMYGSRPKRSLIAALPDPRVPEPIDSDGERPGATLVVYADDEIFADLGSRITSDIPLPVVVIGPTTAPDDARAALSSARAVICMCEDPGTAISLGRYARPLCAATPSAREFLESIETFDIWDFRGAIDALQRTLGAPPTRLQGLVSTVLPSPRKAHLLPDRPPLVSIVVTVYDRLDELAANLGRLSRQSYPNIEIIVVSNNGPRADEICARFPNVRYIHRTENSGAAGEPRNDGIAAARGEFITALDDDDIFFDDHIAAMVETCENGADVVYGNFLIQVVDPRDGGQRLLGYDLEVSTAVTAFELLVQNRIGYMTVFARRSVYDCFPVAYDQINVYGASEVELWLRMAQRFALAKSDRPTTLYTIRKNWKGSLTASDHFKFADGYERMYALYLAEDLPLIKQQRVAHVAGLRSQSQSPPREPRYPSMDT